MADATPRTLTKLKVMAGRVIKFSVGDGTDKLLTITGMTQDGLTINEEPKLLSHEMEDMQEVSSLLSRKCTIEFVFSELDTDDIATINGATVDQIVIETTEGGANSTGETLEMDDCDNVYAHLDNFGTHIFATKTTAAATLPYTLTDNAA